MKLKFVAVTMAAATALFAACNKETRFGQEGVVTEGVPTYASITVAVNNPGTKVATRAASQTGEKEIANVDILIFDKNGVLETVAQGVNATESTGYQTDVIKTTTGQKTVYVIANNGGKVASLTPGLSLSAFEQMMYEAVNVADADKAITVPIATAGQFLMFGSTPATLAEKQQSDPNVVTLSVTRAAAKSQLFFNNVQTSATFQPENTAVTFADASSRLAQMQKQMYVALGSRFSPAGNVTVWDGSYDADGKWIAARTVGFDQNNASEMTTVVEYSHYTAENVNQTPLMNNTTCMLVRVKATPTVWSSEDGSESGDGTFYVIVKHTTDVTGDQNYQTLESYYGIYKDRATADAVLNQPGGALYDAADKAKYEILEYTNGYSYYRLNLRDMNQATSSARYSVLRNNFYKVTVTEINNIGWNNPGELVDPDDERPVETETALKVTITVEDWTDVNMNEPLG